MDKKRANISKEAIVAEYLTGTISYRGLEAKYGFPSRSICDWVLEYQGRKPAWKERKRLKDERAGKTQDPDLPKDNAIAESVNGILKDELLDKVYLDYKQAVKGVAVAISTYNHQRPHGSIDYLTPFEAHFRSGELKRRWKNYYSKVKEMEPEEVF